MTDKEKRKITEALGIPEPDRKKEFAEEFRRRSEETKKKPIMPIVMRITAAAAMLAVCIGAITLFPRRKTDFGGDDNIEITETTVSASEQVDGVIAAGTTKVTTEGENSIIVTTVTAKTTDKKENAVTTVRGSTDGEHSLRPTTAARTTAARTTGNSSVTRTTAAELPEPVTTTSDPVSQEFPVTAPGRDLTVSPGITYTVRDKTISSDELETHVDPIAKGEDGGPDGVGSPIDQKIQHMFDISYAVVLAKVDKIVYTSIDREAVTAHNITVEEVYSGDLAERDRLTLFLDGGYMPAEEYIEFHMTEPMENAEEYSVYVSGGCEEPLEEGDVCVFFISDSRRYLPEGAFAPAEKNYDSVFIKRNGEYVSLGDRSLRFREEQLPELAR